MSALPDRFAARVLVPSISPPESTAFHLRRGGILETGWLESHRKPCAGVLPARISNALHSTARPRLTLSRLQE
jgi:hypothetical protein